MHDIRETGANVDIEREMNNGENEQWRENREDRERE
jgi:hypothetical protein